MTVTFPEKLTLNVTQVFIDNGYRSDCNRCPIALAAAVAVAEVDPIQYYEVEVDGTDVIIYPLMVEYDYKAVVRYALPGAAFLFVSDFDKGYPVEPVVYEAYRLPGPDA